MLNRYFGDVLLHELTALRIEQRSEPAATDASSTLVLGAITLLRN